MNQGKTITTGVLIFFGLILILTFSNATFVTIDAGKQGVLFEKFGGGLQKDEIYGQGFHVVAPWNTLFIYDVRLKEHFEQMQVLSKNGLTIKVAACSSEISFLTGKQKLALVIAYFAQTPSIPGCAEIATRLPFSHLP